MAFEHICSYIREGVTEKQIAAEIDSFMKKNGADDIAFSTIAASGTRASLPHAVPTDEKVKKGDFIVLDYGCTVKGYCSDMTRTVAVGEVSDEKREIYNRVLEAQLMALDSLKAGVSGEYVDKVARDYLDTHYKNAFAHSLGHSVGLYIHEAPNLSPRNKNPLKENTVIKVIVSKGIEKVTITFSGFSKGYLCKKICKFSKHFLKTIYIGGGTPTSLDIDELTILLNITNNRYSKGKTTWQR